MFLRSLEVFEVSRYIASVMEIYASPVAKYKEIQKSHFYNMHSPMTDIFWYKFFMGFIGL